MSPLSTAAQARLRGQQMLLALRIVTPGMYGLWIVFGIFGAFGLGEGIPPWLWEAAVLVAPIALAVYWRPAYRVPDCLWLTFLSALLLGAGGAGWGSRVAPAIGGATLVAMLFVPRDPARAKKSGTWRSRRAARGPLTLRGLKTAWDMGREKPPKPRSQSARTAGSRPGHVAKRR